MSLGGKAFPSHVAFSPPTGKATVAVPPGTQPDAVLRLRGKGLPEFGAARRGDLYVRLRVQIPTRLVAGERKLYEQIRTLGSKSKRMKP